LPGLLQQERRERGGFPESENPDPFSTRFGHLPFNNPQQLERTVLKLPGSAYWRASSLGADASRLLPFFVARSFALSPSRQF
jgi:hypothetical protein